jgi:hypothetical protein
MARPCFPGCIAFLFSRQIIATSTVIGGSTAAGKLSCVPHCFPSIAVFDGHAGGVGRIVVDSTWHHFVNTNLNGIPTGLPGLTNADWQAVQHYFMNIARWMSRKKFMLCRLKLTVIDLLMNSQIIEAALSQPRQDRKAIKLADLASIGALSREILASQHSPSFAYELHLNLIEMASPELAAELNVWNSKVSKRLVDAEDFHQPWVQWDHLVNAAIGSGFIAVRDSRGFADGNISEADADKVLDPFIEGMKEGLKEAVDSLSRHVPSFLKTTKLA